MTRHEMIHATIRHAAEVSPRYGAVAAAFYAPALTPEHGRTPTAVELAEHLSLPVDVVRRAVMDVRSLGQVVLMAAR